jgi:hypothetical protein
MPGVSRSFIREKRDPWARSSGITGMHRICCTLCFLVAAATPVKAQTLDYTCNVGLLQISIHVDIDAQSVTQRVYSGSTVLTAEYMNGVFGRVSERGMATLIPPMRQFVHIDQDAISYGGELDGARDTAILDRRKSILTLPNGNAGWCSMASSTQK